ncbi:hypothetical protein [Lichenibacterium ramalinae]|uniref:Uncharacterized protein n=1 Tax=Lichenibacterium ramalinae TaxID=2316527 RepID=A0A4Q2R6U4_9HYPH|nr:hypothetical protein [Lichenibacterium ramalinae]RYB01423.1 hypothetical protein D3272_26215 [Lichenibacterium ramalinae]
MRGIVVGAVFTLILWVFLGWCGVCACQWLEYTSFSPSTIALASSLACIVVASVAGVVWVASIGEDDAMTASELSLVTFD